MRRLTLALLPSATLLAVPSVLLAQWEGDDVANVISAVGQGVANAAGTHCARRLELVKEGLEAASIGQGIWWSNDVPPHEQLDVFEPGSAPVEYIIDGSAKIIINFRLQSVGAFMNIPDPTAGGRLMSVGLAAVVAHEGAHASEDPEFYNPEAGDPDNGELRDMIERATWTKINPCAGYIPPFPPPG